MAQKESSVGVELSSDAPELAPENGLHARSLSVLDKLEHRADKYWMWEIVGLSGSAICIVLICVIPSLYWYQEAPNWGATVSGRKASVSLNSLLSWFSTIGKICLAMPITKGLGQMKWVWFSTQDRPLADFETYESATRGILGSTFLIWRFRARQFAVLGAITMILSLGFDPAVQNSLIIQTGLKPQKSNSQPSDANYVLPAWIGRTENWDVVDNQVDLQGLPRIDLKTKSTIVASLYDNAAPAGILSNWAIPAYSCVSDNCRFENYVTLGSVARCADVTDKLEKNCSYDPLRDFDPLSPGCDISLPNGLRLGGANNSRTRLATFTTVAQSGLKALVFANYTMSFAVVQSISVNASDLPFTTSINATTRFVASECTVIPAVRLYDSLIFTNSLPKGPDNDDFSGNTQGDFDESDDGVSDLGTVESDGSVVFTPDYTSWPFRQATPKFGHNVYGDPHQYFALPKTISMSARSLLAMQRYLTSTLSGSYDMINNTKHFTDALGQASDIVESIYERPAQHWTRDKGWTASYDHGSWAAYQVATAASVAFRSTPVLTWLRATMDANRNASAVSHQFIPPADLAISGKVYRYVPVVNGQPLYWILPAVLWCLTLGFSIGVIKRTKKSGAKRWRTNPLAVVFLDIGEQEKAQIKGGDLTEKGLSRRAEGMRVRMRVENEGATLVS